MSIPGIELSGLNLKSKDKFTSLRMGQPCRSPTKQQQQPQKCQGTFQMRSRKSTRAEVGVIAVKCCPHELTITVFAKQDPHKVKPVRIPAQIAEAHLLTESHWLLMAAGGRITLCSGCGLSQAVFGPSCVWAIVYSASALP